MAVYHEVFDYVWGDKKSYFGEEYSQKDMSVFQEALTAGATWADSTAPLLSTGHYVKDKKFLTKNCKAYIYKNVDFKSMRPSGFIDGGLFAIFLPMLVNWIVNKIVEYLLNKYK
jgi:hypothetical protein